MIKISLISVFPELHEQFFATSLIKRAIDRNILVYFPYRLSDFCTPKERIDEPTVGPGPGMIIKPEVIERAIEQCKHDHGQGITIFFSPQGTLLTQPLLHQLAQEIGITFPQKSADNTASSEVDQHLILVCTRYEGTDVRIETHYADLILSIGDYVLMGGDLPAQVFLEGFLRLIPDVVGNQASVAEESFQTAFFDHPEYGQPVTWKTYSIPDIIRSGNHAQIAQWHKQEACKKTLFSRFDWFRTHALSNNDIALAHATIPPHYVALMHTQIVLKSEERVGETSIASLDIHDIARASSTYGIKNYFVVSPLQDQQDILRTFLEFWRSPQGRKYNESRYRAVSRVIPSYTLEETIEIIIAQEHQRPLVIATSAKKHANVPLIDYHSQGEIWQQGKPVLFLFGTGQGLSDTVLNQCDYLLVPVVGLTEYNHLSVRSAVSIILDRWMGLNHKLPKAPLLRKGPSQ